MPLIEELPPRVRPRGQATRRLPACGWATVASSQAYGPCHSRGVAAGMGISAASSGGPASSTRTRVAGSSLSLAASTEPTLHGRAQAAVPSAVQPSGR
jgi:hypothetical protein